MSIPIIKAGNEMHENTCYVTGRNGYYLKKENRLFASVTPVKKISSLNKVNPTVEWRAEKIPYSINQQPQPKGIRVAHVCFNIYSLRLI